MHLPKFREMAAFALKLRYIRKVPQKYIEHFDACGIPLIVIPDNVAWMEMMNQVQVMLMNRSMQKFRVNAWDSSFLSEAAYPSRKIERILRATENEMNFPAFLYDVSEQRVYYSSGRFKKEYPYSFCAEDFWEPSFSYSKQLMCPTLQMARYRMQDSREEYLAPFSWITVPINVGEFTKAYFVLLESRERIDNYDEFTIRIAILLLQAVYEQITATQSLSDQGFESFVTYAIGQNVFDRFQLQQQAEALHIRVQDRYRYILIQQQAEGIRFSEYREELKNALRKALAEQEYHIAFLEDNRCLLLLLAKENTDCTAERLYVHINTVRKRIDRAEQMFRIDWEDYMARMKLELMLHLLHI